MISSAILVIAFFIIWNCMGQRAYSQTPTDFSRGIFSIGNWGSMEGITELPDDYFDYLRRLNTQWVVVSNSIHVDNSVDSTVELRYTTDFKNYVPSWPDATLRTMIQQLHNRGYKVILSIGLDEPWPEDGSVNPDIPPGKAAWRYQIGTPITPTGYTLTEWPWNPLNANNQNFVSSFWASYTNVAIYHAKLCQQLGVEVFQVGAESQELFRTSNIGSRYTLNYKTQVKALVDSVRNNYSGKIAYYMHVGTWKLAKTSTNTDTLWHNLWEDANFDIIGVSLYDAVRPTTANYTSTTTVNTVSYFKNLFKTFLTTYVKNVVNRYPSKPVVALELGFQTRDITNIGLTEPTGLMSRDDFNKNGIPDAEEIQANLFEAYFSIQDSLGYPKGAIIFGDAAESDASTALFSNYNGWGIRNREAELRLMRRFRNVTFSQNQNRAPRLLTTSDSDYVAVTGQNFTSKTFIANDDDIILGDTILYRTVWDNYPWFGASTSKGKVVGKPLADDFGWWQVKLFVQDIYGLPSVDTAKFKIWVIHPRSARAISTPPSSMTPGVSVSYQVAVVNQNGTRMDSTLNKYFLNVNPGFLSVNATGKVSGMPTFQVAGTRSAAEVRIITPSNDTLFDSWTVNIQNTNIAPTWENNRALNIPGTTQKTFIISPPIDTLLSADSLIQFKSVSAADYNSSDTLTYSYRIFGNGLDTTLIADRYNKTDSIQFGFKTTRCVLVTDIAKKLILDIPYEWTVTASDGKSSATAPPPNGKFKITKGSTIQTSKLILASKQLNIGTVKVAISKDTAFTIINTGNASLVISVIKSTSTKFKVNLTQQTVPAGGNAKDTIKYTPTVAGGDTAKIIFTSNAPTSPDTIIVTGFGATYSYALSGKTFSFGTVKVGAKKDTTFTISNTGNQPLVISEFKSNSPAFVVNPAQQTIAQGGTQKDTIRFSPTAVGNITAKIVIISNSVLDTISVSGNATLTGVAEDLPLPTVYSIAQNYPNPFNPSTTLRYGLPLNSRVKLQVYNVLGQVVSELMNGEQAAGWHEATWNASVSSGIYFYRIEAVDVNNPKNRFVQVMKMLLLK